MEKNKLSDKKSETNNNAVALSTSYFPYNSEGITYDYTPKHNSKHENQVILLMIRDNGNQVKDHENVCKSHD